MLRHGVQGICDLITNPGLINLDFADVRTVMKDSGSALMGIGYATGENRAKEAAERALRSPLIETEITGARGILLSIAGGDDLTLYEVNEAAEAVREAATDDTNIIFGATIDDRLEGQMWITVVATGIGGKASGRRGELRDRVVRLERRVARTAVVPARLTRRERTACDRSPVAAENREDDAMKGAVAAGHRLTAEAGARMLAEGGNAVDACVAAAFAAWVTESPLTGPGAGGFALVRPGDGRPARLADFFVATPGHGRDPAEGGQMEAVDIGYGDAEATQVFRIGSASCAVPGAAAGLETVHAEYGRLPWAELVAAGDRARPLGRRADAAAGPSPRDPRPDPPPHAGGSSPLQP